jgi:hypothetical protein
MPSIDAEGLLYLFDRHPSGRVLAEDLIAEVGHYEVDADHARAALRDLIAHGTLQWAPGAMLQRPE